MAMPFGSAGQDGSASVQPSGRSRATSRSNSALLLRVRRRPRRRSFFCQSALAASPRSRASRVCLMTVSSTSKDLSGSKPRIFLIATISSAPRAAPWALPVFIFVGRREADDRPQLDERRLVGDRLGVLDRLQDAGDVLAALDLLDVPAVGLVAGGDVLGQRDVGVVLDGDLVVVVEDDQVAQLLAAGDRGRLGGDALLDVAVGGDDVDEVVERALTRRGVRVEQAAFATGGHRHADRGGQTLSERTGGDLDARGVVDLGVSGGQRAPGAQGLQVADLQTEPGQVQLDVQGEAGVTRRTARTGRGPASRRRPGRASSPSGTGCRPAAPGSSPSPGARCRPSVPRRRPAPGRCRRRGCRVRTSRRARAPW